MTPPDRAALHVAIEIAVGVLREKSRTRNEQLLFDEAAKTLRAWLDSGLSDAERETCAGVRDAIDVRLTETLAFNVDFTRAQLERLRDALRPIAEGGKE